MHPESSGPSQAPAREAFVEHADLVRALALSLARDSHEADDLVQETWLAVLGRGWGAGEGLRRRLHGLLRGLASNRRRGEGRRLRRERESARPEAVPPDSDLVERLELGQRVVQAILELDEPYRVVLLMRYEQDLPTSVIARRLGLPLETVRTRLRRALERVRSRLDVVHGGRREWAPALLSFARRTNPGLAPATLSIAMKKALLVSLAALFLGLASWSVVVALRARQPARGAGEPLAELPAANSEIRPVQAGEPFGVASDVPVRSSASRLEAEAAPLEFTILAGPEGRPLPGALVHFASEESLTSEVLRSHNTDLERQLADVGRHTVANDEGRVRLPRRVRGGWICARSGSLWGGRRVARAEAAPHVLELVEDRGLYVRVFDADGVRRGGIPLGLYGVTGHSGGSLWGGSSLAEDSAATIAHIDQRVSQWSGRRDPRWVLRAEIALSPQPEVEVELSTPELRAVELRLPALGRLQVRVVAPDGPSGPLAGHYWLRFEGRAVARGVSAGRGRSVHGMFEGGSFSIENVGLEQRCSIEINGWSNPRLATFQGASRFPGPDSQALVREVEVSVHPTGLHARGRLLDTQGVPIPSASARFLVTRPAADLSSPSVRFFETDEHGVFELAWAQALPGEGWKLALLVEAADGGWYEGEFRFESRVEQLGDLRLFEAPLLASGRVVDEHGVAVAGATVGVAYGPARLDGSPAEQPDLRVISYFRTRLTFLDGTTDADGSFGLHGRTRHDKLSLAAAGAGVVAGALLPFEPGARGLELLAVHPGALRGRVLAPRGTRVQDLWVSLAEGKRISRLGWGLCSPYRMVHPEPSGRFRLESIPFERVTLQVHLADLVEPLIEIPDLRIVRGELASDARLQPLDLSELGHALELRVFDVDARPVPSAEVELRPSARPREPRVARSLRDGRLRTVLPWRRVDVVISAPGFRVAELRAVEGYREVVLEPE